MKFLYSQTFLRAENQVCILSNQTCLSIATNTRELYCKDRTGSTTFVFNECHVQEVEEKYVIEKSIR